ncbi:Maintenance of ploidy protein mob2 [Tulasnella sp. 403]|nr:Maintenance of ploidy protein mob2 [Tulasnella sp. 403]
MGRSMTRAPRPAKRSPTTPDALHSDSLTPTTPLTPSLPTTSTKGGALGRKTSQAALVDSEQERPGPPPLYLSQPFVRAALVKGNFKTIVMLPKWVDVNEWVAINIFDFYTNLNMFYGVLTEFCTLDTCTTMAAGNTLDYTWIDSNRKQVKLPAPTYVDYVFTWVQNLLDDKSVFPTDSGRPFPATFASTAKHIYRQLLRVFAHIFHSHFAHLLHLECEPHFNSLFAHFLAFGKEYDLLDARDIRGAPGQRVGVAYRRERSLNHLLHRLIHFSEEAVTDIAGENGRKKDSHWKMIPNPIRRSASPMAQQQAQPQFIYATPTPAGNPYSFNPSTTSQFNQHPFQTTPSPAPMATNGNGPTAVSASSPDGKPLYLCQPFIRAALVTGKFKSIVVLPKYVDVNEWVAINMQNALPFSPAGEYSGLKKSDITRIVFEFYTNLNLFLGVLSECCTQASCPTMSAGPGIDYTWVDHNRRQLRLAAPAYIDFVTTWIQNSLDDPAIFPTKFAQEFPPNFPAIIKQMYRQLLRLFAHIFFAHYPILLHLQSEGMSHSSIWDHLSEIKNDAPRSGHFNSLFAHFLAFGKEFTLLDPNDIRGLGVGELADRWREMGILES